MIKNLETTKRHILVELRVKGYTEFFLTNFIKFLKQRCFKNFIKLGNNTIVYNKYTLLRSAFINKSSREQIEKRIQINKMSFVFSEFDYKLFYSTLHSLNFKGISLKISKFSFLVLSKEIKYKQIKNSHSFSSIFLSFWSNLVLKKKILILNYSRKRKLNLVFTTISCKNSLSKHLGLKFLRNKSLKKNRLKKGLFFTALKKPNMNEIAFFNKTFLYYNFKKRKNLLKIENYSLKRSSSIFSLCYSYCFNSNKTLELSNFILDKKVISFFSNKEIIQLYSRIFLLNSILRYRKFYIWPLFKNNRKKSDYRRGLSKKVILDKFNLYYKLVLGLKTSPFNLQTNFFLGKNFKSLLIKEKKFFLFSKLLSIIKLKYLNKIVSVKSFSYKKTNKINYSSLLRVYKKLKKNSVLSINPFLIRRYLTKNLDLKKKKKTFKAYEKKNSLIRFLNSHFHFRSKNILFLMLWYKSNLKLVTKKKKIHLKKRLAYILRRKWGTVWKFKSKTKFFFRKKKKIKYWKKYNRNFISRKKKKFKKLNTKKRYWAKRKKKKLNLFKKKKN